ncbi:unnamed protein product [Peniophora sp. CBMAI 1063]|nr:unnamed protein product [Peniophora sp. CBMAI 1063]
MHINDLPAELLTTIYEMVVYDETVSSWAAPTCMKESYWDKPRKDYVLIDPNADLHIRQRRKYAMTKNLMLTSKLWYRLSYYLLFQTIFISDAADIPAVCIAFERTEELAWYVQRMHVVRWYAPRGLSMSHLAAMLVSVIQQCPNLMSFTIEWSLSTAFPDVASSLSMFSSHTLRALRISVTPSNLSRFIWALECLPLLFSCQVDVAMEGATDDTPGPEPPEITPRLGAASSLPLELPQLQQLVVRGRSQALLEHACGWSLPVLSAVTIDFGLHTTDMPDIISFLDSHGSTLSFLDLNTIPAVEVAAVLARCPLLTSFAFNPDWHLPFHEPEQNAPFVYAPHKNIRHIGLHQLLHAFLPGSPELAAAAARTNDATFAQLTRTNFPNLTLVRLLSRPLLAALERNDGPSDGDGMARWERWDTSCRVQGVRLEDCTGAPFGDLPEDEDSIEYYEVDSDAEEIVEEREAARRKEKPDGLQPSNVQELRDLIEQIRNFDMKDPLDGVFTAALAGGPPPAAFAFAQ